MFKYKKLFIVLMPVLLLLFSTLGCERDLSTLEPAKNPSNGEVFIDAFSSGLNYAAFGGSRVDAFQVDNEVKYKGTSSMRIEIPDFEDPFGAYAGGVYFTNNPRDLSGYDVLTFWAKASQPATIDLLGIGNDLGESKYQATISDVKVNTNWKKYYIPIPDPSKLISEKGMFFYSEGPENGRGYTIWFDEVKFEKSGQIAHPVPEIAGGNNEEKEVETGDKFSVSGTNVTFNIPGGINEKVAASPAYFNFASSDTTIAKVNDKGEVTVLDSGSAVITASLSGVKALGSLTLNAVGALPAPKVAAPNPTVSPDSVISLFSNAYTNVPVDTWNPFWQYSTAEVKDIQIAGNDVKVYKKLNFVGIEFTSQTIDASNMTHFHIDVWTPDSADAIEFEVKIIDFGSDNSYGGDNDSEISMKFKKPQLVPNAWNSFDIPLGNSNKAHLAQLVLVGNDQLNTVYIDNLYFYNNGKTGSGGGSNEPTEPAPTPTVESSNVISIYSDAYTGVSGTDFFPDWGQATTASEIEISGNKTLKYAGLNYQGIQLGSNQDVSGMETLHLDVWTSNSTNLNVYLISPGPVEKPYSIAVPTNGWLSLDIPLSSFSPVDLKDVFQFKFDGDGDIYIDNIYFYKTVSGGGSNEPTEPAPVPTYPTSDVISFFSNIYTNVTVDTWSADWDQADVEDIQISGNDTKKYTNLVFAGIEFTSNTIDATSMTHFRMDIWTPDDSALPAVFKIKLVDFGDNGVWDGGGDDVEHELIFDANSTPALKTGQWITFDIPLSDFSNLVTKGHLAQLIISGDPNTVYVDNVLLHK